MNKRLYIKSAVSILVVLAAVATVWRVSALYVGTHMVRAATFALPPTMTVLLPVIVGGAAVVAAYVATRRTMKPAVKTVGAIGVAATVLACTVWTVQGVRWMNRYGYETSAPYTVKLTDATDVPSYGLRLSVPQARLQLRQALSGAAGRIGDVTYIPNSAMGTPEYCATVLRNGTLGRVYTREVLCLNPETGSTRRGAFAETAKVGSTEGRWSSNLSDQVASVRRGLVFNEADVYGYLTETGEPVVVAPVREVTSSGNRRFDVPAGVVTFDVNGNRTLRERVAVGEIPGPVMAMWAAETVRAAVNSREGFITHRKPRRSEASLEGTSTAEGTPATDPNAENPSELLLVRDDGRLVFVTPLTPFGQSQAVVAYLEVVADEVTAGQMPAATLRRFPTQGSLQLVAQRVTTLYDADIEWMEANEASDGSNKARIYEVTPAEPGVMSLTVGTGTQTLYRVDVEARLDAANQLGKICIHRFSTGELIRCDSGSSDPTPVGALRGLATSGGTGNGSTGGAPSVDLSGVSTDDLLAELRRRTTG